MLCHRWQNGKLMNPSSNIRQTIEARRWLISGHVQGVGFRPFVYRLACQYGVSGSVQNQLGRVEVSAEGKPATLDAFGTALIHDAPQIAKPVIDNCVTVDSKGLSEFIIESSCSGQQSHIEVPPDYALCDQCLEELMHPDDRRYRYPFINCTQCGPRYTLIKSLPYDRPNTTMAGFPLCSNCTREYENPLNRRFHAEPIACPECGPQLTFVMSDGVNITQTNKALSACIIALRKGEIVAVKGIGGYHLMCDAHNDVAIARLRATKPRPDKPLAVMFPLAGEDGLAAVASQALLKPDEVRLLTSPLRPIVLARKAPNCSLSVLIAPGLEEVGVMLPYSPLHHLLLSDFAGPLVATSANISGEPVLTDNQDVDTRLAHVTRLRLHHSRVIERPADDPVFRTINRRLRPIRLGRGNAPVELNLPVTLERPVLAVGGHLKNTIALAWDDRVVISPHIGDMDAPRSLKVFEQVLDDLQRLYDVKAERVVCDAHPGYRTTAWAKSCGLGMCQVFHHEAHASALVGEHIDAASVNEFDWLVFAWDGVGYGRDGTLWGGETLLGRPGLWERVGSIRPFHLPGGDKAGREPWRSAAALCWEIDYPWEAPVESTLIKQAWEKRINSPQSSAVGRLFDAATALIMHKHSTSYEGQGPMQLEALADEQQGDVVRLPLQEDGSGVLRTDWSPLVAWLANERIYPDMRAATLHSSLAQALVEQAKYLRREHGVNQVGLTGGVFQNRLLTEQAAALLSLEGFVVKLAEQIPNNDGGISFGQVVEYAVQR